MYRKNTYAHDFLQLSIGVYVLKQYSIKYRLQEQEFRVSDIRWLLLTRGVYGEYTILLGLLKSRMLHRGLVSSRVFKEYLESLTVIAEDDANVLVQYHRGA